MTTASPAPPTAPDDLATAPVPHLVTDVPGPRAREAVARDEAVTSPSLGRVYPLVVARAAGCVVEDVDGNRFLDANAGIAVNSTGHCHPRVVAAIRDQAERLLHYCATDFYVPVYAELCARLAAGAPVGGPARVFLGNSGTEVVEAAIKLARRATGRFGVIAFHGAFHGRTYGSLSLTASKPGYRAGFGPFLPGVHHVPYGVPGAIDDLVFGRLSPPDDIAAVVVEPILGEGGYIVPPAGWLAELRRICDDHGIVLVADEIQSGMGRSGRLWAVEHEGIHPDVLLSAKGLASGMPVAALIARSERMTWATGSHGSTFGGNPVACAAALATLDLVEGGLVANAAVVGAHLLARLAVLQLHRPDAIREVRGRGLMIGLELRTHDDVLALEAAAFRRGLLLLGCGDSTVRIAPPLVVSREQADVLVDVLADALDDAVPRR